MLETLLSFASYLFLITSVFFSLRIFAKNLGILVIPVSYIIATFSAYLCFLFIPNPFLLFACVILSSIVFGFFLRKKVFEFKKIHVPWVLIAISVVVAFFVSLTRWNIFITALHPTTIYFPYATDETKHIAVLTSLVAGGKPLLFPYNLSYAFPYYYLYYLLPAIPLKLFPHAQFGLVWVTHLFLTQCAFYITIAYLFVACIKKFVLQLLGLLAIMFGLSYKLIPKVFDWYHNSKDNHIEHWFMNPSIPSFNQQFMIGWGVEHPISIAAWVPQHEFASMGLLLLYIFLLKTPITFASMLFLSGILVVIFGSSAFLGVGAIGMIIIFALLHAKKTKKIIFNLFISLAMFAIFCIPLFLLLKNNQAHILFTPSLPTLPFMSPLLGMPLLYIIETGPILLFIFILSFLAYRQKKYNKTFLFLSIIIIMPLIAVRFFQSTFNNDFGLRMPILFSLFAPLLFLLLLQQVTLSKIVYKIIIAFTVVSLVVSIGAGILEVYYRMIQTETYAPLYAREYRSITTHTTPSDIVFINNGYFADRIPIFSTRLSLQTQIPFNMAIYVTYPSYKGGIYYGQEQCALYKQIKNMHLPYHIVFVELQGYAYFDCPEIYKDIEHLAPIFTSASSKYYRLTLY